MVDPETEPRVEAPAVDQKGSGTVDTTEAEAGRTPAPRPAQAIRVVPLGVLGGIVGLLQSGWESTERMVGKLGDVLGRNPGGLSPDPVRKPPPVVGVPWPAVVVPE